MTALAAATEVERAIDDGQFVVSVRLRKAKATSSIFVLSRFIVSALVIRGGGAKVQSMAKNSFFYAYYLFPTH